MPEYYQYIRNKKREKIGVLYAVVSAIGYGVGWSKVHKPLDKFDREVGTWLARSRAIEAADEHDCTPPDIWAVQKDWDAFLIRVKEHHYKLLQKTKTDLDKIMQGPNHV